MSQNDASRNIADQYLVTCKNHGCKPNICVQRALVSGILDVSKDYLGSKGCKAIVDIISQMTIRRLDLSNNGLNTEIAIQLGKLMQSMLSLEWVNLSDNCLIMPPAGPVLCSTVSQNKSIQYMLLKGTRISDTTILKIESCCSRNRNISTSVTDGQETGITVDSECQTQLVTTSDKEIQTCNENEEAVPTPTVFTPKTSTTSTPRASNSNSGPKTQNSTSTSSAVGNYQIQLHIAIKCAKDQGTKLLETIKAERELDKVIICSDTIYPCPLTTSCYYGKDKIMPLLIQNGAECNTCWPSKNAEQWARTMGHRRLAYQLRMLQIKNCNREEIFTLKRHSFSKMNQNHPTYNIGRDVLVNIFYYVPHHSLTIASLTCLRWMEVITENRLLLKCGRVRNQPVDEVWAEDLEDVLDVVNFFPYKIIPKQHSEAVVSDE